MYKYFALLFVIAVANATSMEDFTKVGRYINFAIHPQQLNTENNCTFWFNVTDTHQTCTCGELTNVPILKFTADNSKTLTLPAMLFENQDQMKKGVNALNVACDTTVSNMKMLIMKTVEKNYYEVDVLRNDNGKASSFGGALLASKVPKKSELLSFGIEFDNVICYEDDVKSN